MKNCMLFILFSITIESADKAVPIWLKGDIHMHSTYSKGAWTGGDGTPYQLAERALNPGAMQAKLDFIVITDYNFDLGNGNWNNLNADCDSITSTHSNFLAIAGTEVGKEGIPETFSERGHTGAILFRDIPSDVSDWHTLSNYEIIQRIHSYGGLAVANHAGGVSWGLTRYDFNDGGDCSEIIDCIEIYNGMWQFDCQTDMYGNPCGDAIALQKWEEFLLEGKRIVAVGGSDCHTYNEDVPGSRDPDINPYGTCQEFCVSFIHGLSPRFQRFF